MHKPYESSCYNSQHATTCKRSFKIRGPASKHAHKSSLQRHRSPGSGTRKTKHTEEEKKKENKFAICEATTWCVRSVVCGVWCAVVWGGSFNPKACVVHFRDMYSLGSISRARPGQISIRFISKCLITCRLSLNKHTSPSLSLFFSPPFAVSFCSKCV